MTTAVQELGALLRREGELELPTLTDDELAALTPLVPPHARIMPLATLAEVGVDEWASRAEDGERSLLERGLLVEVEGGVRASEELRSILILREQPLSIGLVDVLVGEEPVLSAAFYGAGAETFVLEERAEAGEHRFALRDPLAAAPMLADAIDPDDRAGKDGAPLVRRGSRTPPGWDAVERTIDAPERAARLFAVRRAEEEQVKEVEAAILVGPDGVFLLAGRLDALTGEAEVSATPLSRRALEDALARYVCAATERTLS